jgi:addiction module HigA family antidote
VRIRNFVHKGLKKL